MGAVFGQRYGWERANWFAPPGVEPRTSGVSAAPIISRTSAPKCAAMRRDVGVIDLTPFTKHEVSGPGAGSLARRPGRQQGADQDRPHRAVPCAHAPRRHPLRVHDHQDRRAALLRGQRRRRRALRQRLPAACCRRRLGVNITLRNITTSRGCFVLAGPRSREVLAKLTDAPLDNAAFPWLTGQVAEVGLATDVYLLRVNFVGALGWELHFPIEYAHHLFDALFAAGAEFGIGMAGMRAMESLRMEKSYRMWGSDLTPDYTPFEAGLDRFVRLNKGAFIGKEALEKQLARASRTASSRSRCTASSMPIRSATSRCSTSRASSSAARPRATTATRSARASRSATSSRSSRRSAPN
jgi:dimethylglycine dehydrogenase